MDERSPILPPGPPDFPFEWEDPGDASESWEWDNMHNPTPLAPLAADYCRECVTVGFAYRYDKLELPIQMQARVWNGYLYYALKVFIPEKEAEAMWEGFPDSRRSAIPGAAAYWERAVDELQQLYRSIDAVDVDSAGRDALEVAWQRAWHDSQRAWGIHFWAIAGVYQLLNDLTDAYEALVPTASPGDAARLISGRISALQAMGDEMEQLTDMAQANPAIADWLRAGGPSPAPPDEAFADALEAFLARHGHLGQGWDDLQLASWAEDPPRLYDDLAKRVDRPGERASARRQRLAAEADHLLNDLRAGAADRPDELAAFEALLGTANQIGHITETHNYWIDRMAQATLRRLAVRVGGRLAAENVMDRADDVFYLSRAEVGELICEPHDMRATISERRARHEAQRAITPPLWVGNPPETGSDRFEAPPKVDAPTESEILGAGASPGIVRGPARVVLGQGDFERVQPGDIIVCPSSNPSWVPLFSIAGGLITNTGGVLSHAAVVAREFGLPAVVGTHDATSRIADGRTVEIDGSAGIVRLL